RGNYERPASAPARFKQGDRVRTRNINPETHTRLPRYARGKLGAVEAIRGCHVYPDTAALGDHEHAEWLYTVVFSARELWGEAADSDKGDTYYRHWLRALEMLVAEKGIAAPSDLSRYRDAWHRAADRTPHGMPIALREEDFAG